MDPLTPLAASVKSPVSTPVTLSLKVTVHCTLAALVGVLPTRLMEETVGGVVSTTMFLFDPSECAAPGAARVRSASGWLPPASLIVPPLSASAVVLT